MSAGWEVLVAFFVLALGINASLPALACAARTPEGVTLALRRRTTVAAIAGLFCTGAQVFIQSWPVLVFGAIAALVATWIAISVSVIRLSFSAAQSQSVASTTK